MRWLARSLGAAAALAALAVLAAAGFAAAILAESRPALDGDRALPGLAHPVRIARDAGGVPEIQAAARADLARALGFVHAQERFFQMDLLRRSGAGELAALVGAAALPLDRAHRAHRFRARAQAVLAAMGPDERALLQAYADGVNAGLAALGHSPWEYALLRAPPAAWTPADSLLVTDAMYFALQDSDPSAQLQNEAARTLLGPAMAAFLYPRGDAGDAALDGSLLPDPPMPSTRAPGSPAAGAAPEPPAPGSNNFAVAGRLSATGAAIVENDMHLALGVPNIWFRARLRIPGALDETGVTLPGLPVVVAGSNTHVAWAFTDAYAETGDAVVIETLGTDPTQYRTPDGPKPIVTRGERICAAHGGCETLAIRETIWGPILGQDMAGRPVAWRWIAHDPQSIGLAGYLALERARNVRDAVAAAHGSGIPAENFVVGDAEGHIAWTVIGPVPRRRGLDGRLPQSWADGAHGWDGPLPPDDVPVILDPPEGRLWTANARTLGGEGYAHLGDGDYAGAERARAIRDDLRARGRFDEAALLAIATDDRAHLLAPWQAALLAAIAAHPGPASALQRPVAQWGGRASPDSAGYRLVRIFRKEMLQRIYAGLAGLLAPAGDQAGAPLGHRPDGPALRLLAARTPALTPPPFRDWDALEADALGALLRAADAAGGPARFTWGSRNRTGLHHPLALAVPLLGRLTDPPDLPLAGDTIVPRVAIPGFGASERMVISPGHEDRALFDMPAGQSDNPWTPYYGAGEQAWVDGRATPFLPGPPRWVLTLRP